VLLPGPDVVQKLEQQLQAAKQADLDQLAQQVRGSSTHVTTDKTAAAAAAAAAATAAAGARVKDLL
jgi:malate/lactate dehydrogenase